MAEDLGIVDALAQLSFLVQGLLAKHSARHDLSLIQTRLLGILRDREPTMRELAEFLDLDKSSTTGLVDRAERRGLVTRVPSDSDRRAIHVSLAETGRQLVTEVADAFAAEIEAATSGLSDPGVKRLSRLASAVVRNANASHI